MKTHTPRIEVILAKLAGGDRRSLGHSAEVVAAVRRDPSLVPALALALEHPDPVVRGRAADALEKATRTQPAWLHPVKRTLLRAAQESRQAEVRWHLAQMLSRLALGRAERRTCVSILRTYLRDPSSIVRTFALQALADLAATDSSLRAEARATIESALAGGSPAMRARGRKLLACWPRDARPTTDTPKPASRKDAHGPRR